MNLRSAKSANEDEIVTAFALALKQARAIYDTVPKRDGFVGIDPEGMQIRDSAMIKIFDVIDHIGTDDFQKPDVEVLLSGSPICPFQDWTLFAIANALDYCHEAAMCGGDGDGPGHRKTGMGSLADGLKRLRTVTDAKGLTVTNTQKRPWSKFVQEQIGLQLLDRGALGVWNAAFMEDGRTLVFYPANVVEQELLTVQIPVWFKFVAIDGTIVLETEANAFRVERALEIGLQLIELNEQAAVLNERQRAVLLPFTG